VEVSECPDDRARLADFVAREAVRLSTPPMPRFAKPLRAPYEAPEGWRSWGVFARYGEVPDGR
jgi:hypothetical protein